jgi:hypothetical protein
MVSWLVGKRDAEWGEMFMIDPASRLTNRVQLTSDGHKAYLVAVDAGFGIDIDFAMLVKLYGESQEQAVEKRYIPAKYVSSKKTSLSGQTFWRIS